ncbi:response regulator [Hymenobacter sp. APR13]|uniref:response regulator n=1 Tax=Hymenobacter sp. APR13 TaxID=1356852 RepID=UPI0004E076B1|nr:response regulator [Hymenobacter sp. APR13]AII52128.1 hypothetical protein N008_09075 [Hymenobacter sp. APR13]
MNILVVDDETDVKPLFELRFRREIRSGEHLFTFVFSGEDALEYLHQHPTEPVVVLSDINMPGMSGLELLRRIRSSHELPATRVLMLTANADDASRQQARYDGAEDLLAKPVDFAALKHKLSLEPAA